MLRDLAATVRKGFRIASQSLRPQRLPAKDGEVACGLYPCVVLRHDVPGAVSETTWPMR
jgi:hypothetical protein